MAVKSDDKRNSKQLILNSYQYQDRQMWSRPLSRHVPAYPCSVFTPALVHDTRGKAHARRHSNALSIS